MVIFKTVNDVRSQVKEWKKQGLKVGLLWDIYMKVMKV